MIRSLLQRLDKKSEGVVLLIHLLMTNKQIGFKKKWDCFERFHHMTDLWFLLGGSTNAITAFVKKLNPSFKYLVI